MALINYLGIEYYPNGSGGGYLIHITTTDTNLYGNTITITKDSTVLGTTTFDNTGNAEYTVQETGTYVVSTVYSGQTFSSTVEVVPYNANTFLNAIPVGATVTPTDDIQIWLNCANIWDKEYTTLAEVLEDETTLLALMSNNNAVDYMVRSKTFIGVYPKTTFENIQRILDAHSEEEVLSIGDTITVTLTTGEEVDFQVGAINHSGEADHSIIWVAKNCLATTRQMNSTNTNVGGWNSSALRTWLNGTFYNQLPEGVKEYVADRVTKASAGNQSTNIINSTDKIFLPREYEIFGATTYAAATEQSQGGAKQFPIFAVADNRKKTLGKDGVTPVTWWNSSSVVSESESFCYVSPSGAANGNYASRDYGVVPCFLQSANTPSSTKVTDNSIAMTDIGANNYCANTLLSDEDWLEAICNSEYMESVLNVKVPTMTSNTTPSGECNASSYVEASQYPAWKAFDGISIVGGADMWNSGQNMVTNQWIYYMFPSAVCVKAVKYQSGFRIGYTPKNIKIQGSNDGSNYTDLASHVGQNTTDVQTIILNNLNSYKYYRFFVVDNYGSTNIVISMLQFYGRS